MSASVRPALRVARRVNDSVMGSLFPAGDMSGSLRKGCATGVGSKIGSSPKCYSDAIGVGPPLLHKVFVDRLMALDRADDLVQRVKAGNEPSPSGLLGDA